MFEPEKEIKTEPLDLRKNFKKVMLAPPAQDKAGGQKGKTRRLAFQRNVRGGFEIAVADRRCFSHERGLFSMWATDSARGASGA